MSDWRYGTRRWRQLRAGYLGAHPKCERCQVRRARLVHHRKPVAEGGAWWSFENLESLCNGCHERIHKRAKKVFNPVDSDWDAYCAGVVKKAGKARRPKM